MGIPSQLGSDVQAPFLLSPYRPLVPPSSKTPPLKRRNSGFILQPPSNEKRMDFKSLHGTLTAKQDETAADDSTSLSRRPPPAHPEELSREPGRRFVSTRGDTR